MASNYDTIYRDKANGTIEHFMYCEGDRVFVSRAWSENQVARGYARYVDLWKTAEQNARAR